MGAMQRFFWLTANAIVMAPDPAAGPMAGDLMPRKAGNPA
jgi:hypothetical protein